MKTAIWAGAAAAAAAVVLVAGTVIVRTLTLSAPAVPEAAPPIQADANLAARHLSEAIRMQTVSYGDGIKEKEKSAALQDMQRWLEQTYPNFHEAAGPEAWLEEKLGQLYGQLEAGDLRDPEFLSRIRELRARLLDRDP